MDGPGGNLQRSCLPRTWSDQNRARARARLTTTKRPDFAPFAPDIVLAFLRMAKLAMHGLLLLVSFEHRQGLRLDRHSTRRLPTSPASVAHHEMELPATYSMRLREPVVVQSLEKPGRRHQGLAPCSLGSVHVWASGPCRRSSPKIHEDCSHFLGSGPTLGKTL